MQIPMLDGGTIVLTTLRELIDQLEQISTDKRAGKEELSEYYRFALIDDTILELGNLLAPGENF